MPRKAAQTCAAEQNPQLRTSVRACPRPAKNYARAEHSVNTKGKKAEGVCGKLFRGRAFDDFANNLAGASVGIGQDPNANRLS